MVYRLKSYDCPLCKGDLGSFDPRSVFLVTCIDPDCKVKWCFKPGVAKPIAIDYPGMKKTKRCECNGCSTKP